MPLNDILFGMPLLIRIILQRLLLVVFSSLALFGINIDYASPSPESVEANRIRQDEIVGQILQPTDQKSEGAAREIEDRITDLQDAFTQNITNPFADAISEKVVPQEVVTGKSDGVVDVRDVVVNVLCLEKTSSYTKMSSGSGVIISESGLVITNAHVAYPFLQTKQFDDTTYSCSVRRENIPNFGYNAELVYYPIDWLKENGEVIKGPSPVGTGENDYALILLTTPLGPGPVSPDFSPASLEVRPLDLLDNLSVTIAGYPSLNSGVFEVDTNPGLKIADTQVREYFTFGTRSLDVLQTGENVVARRGSSGGGVFSGSTLYGLIVTTNQGESGTYANALTLPYIKRDFAADTGIEFDEFISRPVEAIKSSFILSQDELKRTISESLGR
jgi:hypothetical protein